MVKKYPFPSEIKVIGSDGEPDFVPMSPIKITYLIGDSKENICVIPTQDNAQYKKWYVNGGFSASVDFQIAYKCFPGKSAQQKVIAQEIVSRIMEWLENTDDLPLLTDYRKVTEITLKNTFATVDDKGEDGNMVFVSEATLDYKKRGKE